MTLSKQTLNAKLMELSAQFDAYKSVENITVTSSITSSVSSETWSCKRYTIGNGSVYHITGVFTLSSDLTAYTAFCTIPVIGLNGIVSISPPGGVIKIGWARVLGSTTALYNSATALVSGSNNTIDCIIMKD